MSGRFRPPCRFFLQGQCRNGDSCKFSHERPFSGRASSGRANAGNDSARSNGGGGPFGDSSNRRSSFGGGARGGGSNPFGGGSAASSGATGPASDTVRLATIEELRNPSLWPLSGFAVNKAVRLLGFDQGLNDKGLTLW
ncbi:hypothetical protein PINS_up005961 [Pythium insidiosum]|nr:hypothetical protein PINS_up005961 [Pythium insidiosum]